MAKTKGRWKFWRNAQQQLFAYGFVIRAWWFIKCEEYACHLYRERKGWRMSRGLTRVWAIILSLNVCVFFRLSQKFIRWSQNDYVSVAERKTTMEDKLALAEKSLFFLVYHLYECRLHSNVTRETWVQSCETIILFVS